MSLFVEFFIGTWCATDDDIKERVECAFSPLRCVAEVWDYGYRIRFKVFDSSNIGVLSNKKLCSEIYELNLDFGKFCPFAGAKYLCAKNNRLEIFRFAQDDMGVLYQAWLWFND